MKCDHVYRVSVHPSVKIGGVSVGQCEKDVLPGFVVCFEHVNKEALWMMLQSERHEIAQLKKNVRGTKYKGKTPRQAVKEVSGAIDQLDVSKKVKGILKKIVAELDGAWMDKFVAFKTAMEKTK